MATAALIPLQEYLSTVYEPDCDYVDGHLEERNAGEYTHAATMGALLGLVGGSWREWGILPLPVVRVQVAPSRIRVPDITILRRSDPRTPIVRTAPLICIEVLSPEDRIQRMQECINDYVRMGVPHIWLIDPTTRDCWIAQSDGSHLHVSTEFTVPGTPIRISLPELFAELDDMQSQS